MRHSTAIAAAVALAGGGCAVAAAGCGGGGESDEDRVRATLKAYGEATAERDVQALCDRILAPALVLKTAEAGLPCEVALQRGLAEVRRPTLRVDRVDITDRRALARVHTEAADQPPSDDTILLTKVGSGWRLAALSLPQPQPAQPVGP